MVVTLHGSGKLTALHYPAALFEQIRLVAVEKFLSIPRGGLEIGGVLFGRIDGDVCTIEAHRPLTIEYKTGPSFRLSEADEAALSQLLDNAEGLKPVGWYHTHTRSDLAMTEDDAATHRKFFADPRQFALILKPFKFEPVQAAVYVEGQTWATFQLDRLGRREASAEGTAAAIQPVPVPLVVAETEPVQRPWRWSWVAAGFVAAGLAGAALWKAPEPKRPSLSPVVAAQPSIRVSDTAGQLNISWDGDAAWARAASGGELRIRDGSLQPSAIPVDADFLRRGTVTYARRSGDVDVRLNVRMKAGTQAEAVARFVGPEPEAKAAPVAAKTEPATFEVEKARVEPPRPAPARVLMMESSNRALPTPSSVEPPSLQVSPTGQLQVLPLDTPKAASVPAMRPAPAKKTARVIWTGALPPGAQLAVDNGRASSGILSQPLPATPGRIRVYAADLAASGMTVYTADGGSDVERPSAANGWNQTTYRKDPKRSRSLTVLEHPNAQNDYRRLVVRAEGRPISVLVIEWEEM